MKRVLGAFLKHGNVSFVAIVVLLALIWFGGEILGVDSKTRAIGAVVVLALWLAVYVAQKVMVARSAALIEKRLAAQAREQLATIRPDRKPEVEALQKQLDEAIQSLKASKMGKSALYTLPWYIIIGPPGSGKSTALQESGLDFPYMREGGSRIRGIGGTRNCDWWLTADGILLDTAGRYTTEIEDKDEWLSFLDLLRKARKSKPINGALVCVSVSELLEATDEGIEAHAKKIRERLDELTGKLQMIFPVYLLFTKCDLLTGFVEIFEDLGKSDREQVWGFTLPYESTEAAPKDVFEDEWKKLYASLASHRVDALSRDRPADRRRRIFQFPLQFGLAERRLAEFVGGVFKPNPFQEAAILRGCYFTSGTQEGNPIDQVLTAMGDAFGLKPGESMVAGEPVTEKKSYFLHDLFTKVIFPDQTLAGRTTAAEKQRRILRWATGLLSVVGGVGLVIALLVSFFGNAALVAMARGATSEIEEVRREASGDFGRQLFALSDLRKRMSTFDRYEQEGVPFALRWGLYRGDDIVEGMRPVYYERLRTLILEPCARRLADEVKERVVGAGRMSQEYIELYDVYHVYQMLTGKLEPDRDLVRGILGEDDRWLGAEVVAGLSEDQRKLAAEELEYFAARIGGEGVPVVTPEGADIVPLVNEQLTGQTWITYNYRAMIRALQDKIGADDSYPEKVSKDFILGGAGKETILVDYEFSTLFTQKGYDDYVKFQIGDLAKILATKMERLEIDKSQDEIEADLRQRYRDDYVEHWEEFVKQVQLAPFEDVDDASRKLRVLGGKGSPLMELVKRVQDLQVLKVSAVEKTKDLFDLEKIRKLIGKEDPAAAGSDDLEWVETALESLKKIQEEFDQMIGHTREGSRVLPYMADGKLDAVRGVLDGARNEIQGLAETGTVDERMSSLFLLAVTQARLALVSDAQKEINGLWDETIHKVWWEGFVTRFPFSAGEEEEVPVATFSEMFNPVSGLFWKRHAEVTALADFMIDGKPLIDTTREYEESVKRVETLREALYRGDKETIDVRFRVTLVRGQGVADMRISLGPKRVGFYDKPDHTGELVWDEESLRGAKVQVQVAGKQDWLTRSAEKEDWGLLRLLQDGSISKEGDRTYRVVWEFETELHSKDVTYTVEAELEAEDEQNPFPPEFFREFSIPSKVCP